MTFTQATTEHLLQTDKQIDYCFELRTNCPGSSEWLEYPLRDFNLVKDTFAPAVLRAELINSELDFSDEASADNRTQLLAETRLTAVVQGESRVLFQGRVQRIEPTDEQFILTCFDWLALVNECDCDISLAPDETAEITTPRQVTLVAGGRFGSVFGFTYSGVGDPAFNTEPAAGTRRRAWSPGDIRLYYDAAATTEVPPPHYRINLTGGSVTILEDTAGRSYYAAGVRCYLEGTLDWAEVFRQALQWPVGLGGIGADTADLDLPDTGLDLAGPLNFKGRVGDLVRRIQQEQQANLRLWYESATGCYKLQVVVQAERGSEDWTLCCPCSIAQPRDIKELYSRVVAQGRCEQPQNALTETAVSITDITSAGDWFAWDGLNVGSDAPSPQVLPLLFDGDSNLGAGVHNLAASEHGGTDKYDSWYDFIEVDLGEESRLDRLRVTMPGSRNVNAMAGHQGLFWPGVRIVGSLDGTIWRLISATLCGRYAPNAVVEAQAPDLLLAKARYLKVQLGAYKHGFENQADPSIGLAELEVHTAERYEVVKAIQDSDPAGVYEYTDGTCWSNHHPGLLTRLGGRQRSLHVDLDGDLNEYLAHDHALDQLAESIRLFQQVTYHSVADPRVGLFDTVAATDEMNGTVAGILVERIELSRSGTRISGTDYQGSELGNGGTGND